MRHLSEQNFFRFLPSGCTTGTPQCRHFPAADISGCLRICDLIVLTDIPISAAIFDGGRPDNRSCVIFSVSCFFIYPPFFNYPFDFEFLCVTPRAVFLIRSTEICIPPVSRKNDSLFTQKLLRVFTRYSAPLPAREGVEICTPIRAYLMLLLPMIDGKQQAEKNICCPLYRSASLLKIGDVISYVIQ